MIRHNQTLVEDSLKCPDADRHILDHSEPDYSFQIPNKEFRLLTDPTPELYPVTPAFPETQPSKTATDLHGDPTA